MLLHQEEIEPLLRKFITDSSDIDNYGYYEDICFNVNDFLYKFYYSDEPVEIPLEYISIKVLVFREFVFLKDVVEIKDALRNLVAFFKEKGLVFDFPYDIDIGDC